MAQKSNKSGIKQRQINDSPNQISGRSANFGGRWKGDQVKRVMSAECQEEFYFKHDVTRGKVNAFELRGFENPVSASQSEQKAFVFELSNDLLIGQ